MATPMERIGVKPYAAEVCLSYVLKGVAGTSRGGPEYAQKRREAKRTPSTEVSELAG